MNGDDGYGRSHAAVSRGHSHANLADNDVVHPTEGCQLLIYSDEVDAFCLREIEPCIYPLALAEQL